MYVIGSLSIIFIINIFTINCTTIFIMYFKSNLLLVNKAWNVPQTGFKNKSYVCLEERYWNRFWDKVFTFSLKLILEVPCHQYGNAAVGVFLFWPQLYHYVIFKTLKSSSESRGIYNFHLEAISIVITSS